MSSFPGRARANSWAAFMVWVLGWAFPLPEEPQFLFQGRVVLQTHRAAYVISSPTNQDARRNQPGTSISVIS